MLDPKSRGLPITQHPGKYDFSGTDRGRTCSNQGLQPCALPVELLSLMSPPHRYSRKPGSGQNCIPQKEDRASDGARSRILRLGKTVCCQLHHGHIFSCLRPCLRPEVFKINMAFASGPHGDRTRHLLLAKQASLHCDFWPGYCRETVRKTLRHAVARFLLFTVFYRVLMDSNHYSAVNSRMFCL